VDPVGEVYVGITKAAYQTYLSAWHDRVHKDRTFSRRVSGLYRVRTKDSKTFYFKLPIPPWARKKILDVTVGGSVTEDATLYVLRDHSGRSTAYLLQSRDNELEVADPEELARLKERLKQQFIESFPKHFGDL